MPLNKVGLQAQLTQIMKKKGNTEESFAADLADAIDAYVKTATVNTTVAVVVGGVAGTGTGVGGLT